MLMVIEFIGMNGKGERKEKNKKEDAFIQICLQLSSVEHKRAFTKHRSITRDHSEVTLFNFNIF